jgi:hypothetical protein
VAVGRMNGVQFTKSRIIIATSKSALGTTLYLLQWDNKLQEYEAKNPSESNAYINNEWRSNYSLYLRPHDVLLRHSSNFLFLF